MRVLKTGKDDRFDTFNRQASGSPRTFPPSPFLKMKPGESACHVLYNDVLCMPVRQTPSICV